MEDILAGLALILVLGVMAQWLAWRFRLPSILLLLLFGFIAGPISGVLNPDQMFGELLFPLVSLSVAIILFEGGLTLKIFEIQRERSVIINLISVGMLVTWLVAAAAAYFILGLDISLSVLLGAILTVSGPTVVLPLLRHVRPRAPLGSILKWEGILIDPVGAVMAVLVFEAIMMGRFESAYLVVLEGVAATALVGGGLGVIGGLLMVRLLRKGLVPDYLQIPVSLMILVLIFVLSNMFFHESGLLAVTVMGMILANAKDVSIHEIIEFKENLRVLLISLLFILLAARVDLNDFETLGWSGAIFLAVIIVVARPAAVFVSTWRSDLSIRERVFLSFVAPRGIVAAAVASLFAISLEAQGSANAHYLVTYTFLIIVGTVVVYSLLGSPFAKLLGVQQEKPQGALFVGANGFARALAKEIESEGFKAVLVDTNRSKINIANMEGLTAYHGNILSEHVLEILDLDGIGRVLSLTPNDEANSLACVHFAELFGKDEVFQLTPSTEGVAEKSKAVSERLRGRFLFGENLSYAVLTDKFVSGADIKTTELSEEFGYEEYSKHHGEAHIPLFVIDEEKKLRIVRSGEEFEVLAGQKIISLIEESA